MRKSIFLLIVVVALAVPLAVLAQGDGPDAGDCEFVLFTGTMFIDEQQAAIAEAQEAEDYEAVAEALNNISRSASSMSATCRGWEWSGTGNEVIGPITLDEGVYIIDYTVAGGRIGWFELRIENVDDDELVSGEPFESVEDNEVAEGQGVVRIDGGSYLIVVEAEGLADDGWTFRLARA